MSVNTKATALVFVVSLIVMCVSTRSARADDWQPWHSAGVGISVSFKKVDKDTWTWRFRNDAPQKVTFLEFTYDDTDGQHRDVLPATLGEGEIFGGWSAFTASTSHVNLNITKIKRE